MKYSREIKVGAFAILCVFLLFFGFNYLKGVNIFSSIHAYHGVYTDIHGLETQAPVYIKGYKVGQVDNITYDFTRDSAFTVDISIKRNISLPVGTRMALVSDGIMGGMAVELILPAEQPQDMLASGATLSTSYTPGLLDGLQESVIKPLGNTLASLDTVIAQLKSQLDNDHIEHILASADIAVADLQTTSASLKRLMNTQVPSIAAKADTAMTDLQQVIADVRAADLKSTVASVDTAIANVNLLLADVRSTDGTVGMLINDKALYSHIDSAILSVDSLLVDLKANPKRYVHFSLFGAKEKKNKK